MKKIRTAKEAFDYVDSEITKRFEQDRFRQEMAIWYFREDVLSGWENNESITLDKLNSTFKELCHGIDDDIHFIETIITVHRNMIIERFGEAGMVLQQELDKISRHFIEELEADKKKLQKLKSGWSIVLAGYKDMKYEE